MAESVTINVKPSAMIDEVLDILVTGLEKESKITLRSQLVQGKASLEAHGHYIADSNGRVKLSEEPSVGGTYYGLDPMGLFWSMGWSPSGLHKPTATYYHKDTTAPQIVTLSLHKGHVSAEVMQKADPVTSCTVKRWFMSDDIERVLVRYGRIRGVLYKPKGSGPFPGLIYIYGVTEIVWDYMPCLLASYGFASLYLMYYYHDDLPKAAADVELEYFYEAIDWFSNEPYVKKGGIQIVGTCFGGTVALLLASRLPDKITSVVPINSFTVMSEPSLKYEGKSLPHIKADETKIVVNTDGSFIGKNSFNLETAPEESHIKIEDARKILFIIGDDDHAIPGLQGVKHAIRRLQSNGHTQYELILCPGTGHLIYTPYQPVVTKANYKSQTVCKNMFVDWGGKLYAQAKAHEDVWTKLKQFLLKNV